MYLDGKKRVFAQSLEELAQNKVDQINKVFVRLFARE